MTRTTNARIAGFTFLFYIAIGITGMLLFSRVSLWWAMKTRPLVGVGIITTLRTCYLHDPTVALAAVRKR